MCMFLFNKDYRWLYERVECKSRQVGKTYFRKNKDGMLIGYKALNVEEDGTPYSIYLPYQWKLGMNLSGRTSTSHDSIHEDRYGIDRGFHVFATARGARGVCYPGTTRAVFRVLINPKDVVAEGVWSDYPTLLNLVCTRLTLPSLEPIYKASYGLLSE